MVNITVKSWLISLLFLWSSLEVWAQNIVKNIPEIQGIVVNHAGEVIPSCSISLLDGEGNTLNFSITQQDGKFTLSIPKEDKHLKLTARHMSYGTYEKIISYQDQTIEITLPEKTIEMEEVSVKQTQFIQSGDTLRYLLEAFSNPHDRTLADVLSKIPGIEVAQNGQIKFNGTPINRFYVEGKDLMGGRYGVITNSLPNADVQSIEILQEHQPIKMREGRIPSSASAINIKLKSGISFTGRGESFIGNGLARPSPYLWQHDITPVLLTQGIQSLLSYKGNNTGTDLISQFSDHIVSLDPTDHVKLMSTGNFLNLNLPVPPPLNHFRYLNNRTHVFSGNILSSFGNEWTMKFNLLAYQDVNINESNEISSVYSSENIPSLTYENILNHKERKNRLQGGFIIEQNSTSRFIKNNLNFQLAGNRGTNHFILNNNAHDGKLKSPAFGFQNSFTGIVNITPDIQVQINSYFNLLQDDQNYELFSENGLHVPDKLQLVHDLIQRSEIKSFETGHRIHTDLFVGKWSFKPFLGFNSTYKTLKTESSTPDFSQSNLILYNNDSQKNDRNINGGLGMLYQTSKIQINATFPLNNEHTQVQVKTESSSNEQVISSQKIFFNPSVFMKYRWGIRTEVSGNISIKNSWDQPAFYYPNNVLNGISFSNQQYAKGIRTQNTLNTKISYQIPEKFINFYLTQQFTSIKKDNITQFTLLENGQQFIQQIDLKHKNQSAHYRFVANQHLNNLQSNYTLGLGYGITKAPIILNHTITKASLNSYEGSIRWLSNFGTQWAFSTNLRSKYHHRQSPKEDYRYQELHSQISIFYTFFEKNHIEIKGEFSQFIARDFKSRHPFLDLHYKYSWEKRKIDFEIKYSNIFQEKTFKSMRFHDLMMQESVFNIRPSEFLIGISYPFSAFRKGN